MTKDALYTYRKLGAEEIFLDITTASRKDVTQAEDEGFKIYACIWAFRALDGRFGVENIHGEKMLWAGSGCPNNPMIKKNCLKKIKNVLSTYEGHGIALDGIRFPSPGSGLHTFLTCFCEYCCEKGKNFGVDLAKVKDFLKKSRNPVDFIYASCHRDGHKQLSEWIDIRCKSITEDVRSIKEFVKDIEPKVEVGAAIFAPSLAPLVGQNYLELGSILDFIHPMIYHKGEGLACINFELAKLIEEFVILEQQADALDYAYKMLNYDLFEPPLSPRTLMEKGLPLDVIGVETKKGKKLVGGTKARFMPIAFILESDREEFKKAEEQVMNVASNGIVYFSYYENLREIFNEKK